MDFFNSMDPLLRILWYIAIPTSLIFIIQTIMTFTGSDAHDGVDADFDSNLHDTPAPFQLFTLRNLINFFLGFSWAGISFYEQVKSPGLLIVISVATGVAFVAVFFFIIRQLEKLAEDNTFKITSALNQTGSVYLTIPANKQGKGKVQVSVNGSVHELEAITESERIETSSLVRIVRIENSNIVVVERI